MKKIISIPTKVKWDWHLACELEIIEKFPSDYKVEIFIPHYDDIHIDTSYPEIWFKEDLRKERLVYYSKLFNAYNLLGRKIEIKLCDQVAVGEDFRQWLAGITCEDLRILRDLEYEGYHIGASALSSYVSETRSLLEGERQLEIIKCFLLSAYKQYLLAEQVLTQNRPDELLIFNGRFSSSRAFYDTCKKRKIPLLIHERGSDKNKYEIFKNYLPHDQGNFQRRLAAWAEGRSEEEISVLADEFYKGRANGEEQGWMSFTKEQEAESLPEGWDDEVQNIVIFNSSEDEFFSIGAEWHNHLGMTQNEIISKVVKEYGKEKKSVKFWLRVHPNSESLQDATFKELVSLNTEQDNFSIIPADSAVDTYHLISKSNKVLTFGSTVGIEATYWGKVSILAGQCFYKSHDATYFARSYAELVELLDQGDLIPKPSKNAHRYGAFMNNFGTEFKNAHATGFFGVTFKEKKMKHDKKLVNYLEKEISKPDEVGSKLFFCVQGEEKARMCESNIRLRDLSYLSYDVCREKISIDFLEAHFSLGKTNKSFNWESVKYFAENAPLKKLLFWLKLRIFYSRKNLR